MSLGLTKPGASAALRHPKTGAVLAPLGHTKSGKAIWPVLGASSDDPDDPAYTGGGPSGGSSKVNPRVDEDEDDDLEDEDDEDEEEKKDDKKSKKDENDKKEPSRPERQAARYRTQLREEQKRAADLEERLRRIEDSDKPQDEILKRDAEELKSRVETLTEVNRVITSQLAFFKANQVDWVDSSDAFSLAEREGLFDDIIDEDGNVDTRELRRGLADLAKRKPHLVKKARSQGEDKDKDNEPSSKSASTMNGTRRGSAKTTDRQSLSKRFPVLGR